MDPPPETRSPDSDEISAAPAGRLEIEGYQIIRELGRGGQGVVLLGIQLSTKRKVAIKVLREGAYASAAAQRRFLREIELAAGLKHPAIVTIFQSGTAADGRLFYVMDYVRGTPITEYVRQGRLNLQQTLGLFKTVCDGVAHAHQRGVIHRDLKPSNILVDADGSARILDFGLAKTIGGTNESAVSQTGEVMGTLRYMSPEQTRGNPDEIDVRSDVYSLGTILYETATGKSPYPVDGAMIETLRHISQTEPLPPHRNWSSDSGIIGGTRLGRCPIDQDLSTIILKSLAKDRDRRYQTAGEFSADLRRYISGEPIEARRDSSWYLMKKLMSRYRLAAVAAAIIAGVAAVALVVSSIAWHRAALDRDAAIAARNDADGARRLADVQEQASRLMTARLLAEQHQFAISREILNSVDPNGPVAQDWRWAAWEFFRQSREVGWTDLNQALAPGQRMITARECDGNCWIDVPHQLIWTFSNQKIKVFDLETGSVTPVIDSAPPSMLMPPAFVREDVRLEGARPDQSIVLEAHGYPTRSESLLSMLKPNGSLVWKEEIPSPGITGVGALSTDGSVVALAMLNDSIQIRAIHPDGSTLLRSIDGIHDDIVAMAFDTDSQRLHVITGGWIHRIFDVAGDADVERTSPAHTSTVRRLAFDATGRLLASGSYDGHVKVWDTRTHQMLTDILAMTKNAASPGNGIIETRFLPDGRIVTMDAVGVVKIIDWRSGASVAIDTGGRGQDGLAFADDGRSFYSTGSNAIRVWHLDPTPRAALPFGADLSAPRESNYRALLMKDKNILVVLRSTDYHIPSDMAWIRCQIWDLNGPTLVRELRHHTDGLRDMDVSPDGKIMAISSRDGTASLWDWQSGTLLHVLNASSGHSDTSIISGVRFDPAEPVVATAGQDGHVIFWSSQTGRQLAEIFVDEEHRLGFGHGGLVKDIAFSPDGKTLVIPVDTDIWWLDLTAFDQQISDLSRAHHPTASQN